MTMFEARKREAWVTAQVLSLSVMWQMVRCGRKKVRATRRTVYTLRRLKRESLLHASEKRVKKNISPLPIAHPWCRRQNYTMYSTFSRCIMITAHSLRHLWCSFQRSSCHLSLLHQFCVEDVEIVQKASLWCQLNNSNRSRSVGSSSSLCPVLFSCGMNEFTLPCSFRRLYNIFVVFLKSSRLVIGLAWTSGSPLFIVMVFS